MNEDDESEEGEKTESTADQKEESPEKKELEAEAMNNAEADKPKSEARDEDVIGQNDDTDQKEEILPKELNSSTVYYLL